MAARPLDLQILHRGRPIDTVQGDLDPQDPSALAGRLKGWLAANKWDEGRWREFEIIARDAGKSKQLAKVGL
jgi:hypothetical protein